MVSIRIRLILVVTKNVKKTTVRYVFVGVFAVRTLCWNMICTITISYKISSNTIFFTLPDEVCMFRRNQYEKIKKLTRSTVAVLLLLLLLLLCVAVSVGPFSLSKV